MTGCSVVGCTRRHDARGWCNTHYTSWRRTGNPLPTRFDPRPCSIEDCTARSRQRGLCHKHYERLRRTGNTADRHIPSLRERFEALVLVTPTCWLWTGTGTRKGYGQIGVNVDGKKRMRYAHRVAYELYVGPIPHGLHIDHVRDRGCTSSRCVNPAHLEPVTPAENNRRALAYRRAA